MWLGTATQCSPGPLCAQHAVVGIFDGDRLEGRRFQPLHRQPVESRVRFDPFDIIGGDYREETAPQAQPLQMRVHPVSV